VAPSDNIDVTPPALAAEHCSWLVADLEETPDLWDLATWAATGRELLGELRQAPSIDALASRLRALGRGAAPPRLRPLLPPELLPKRWPGTDLRSRYDEWDRAYRNVLAAWHRSR